MLNMNALLDYGSSSNDSDEDYTENEKWLHYLCIYYYCLDTCTTSLSLIYRSQVENSKPKLPKPTIGESSLQTSVFSNPFVEAELAKAAILEKHVKMVDVDFLLLIGIWKFIFAHDLF